MIKNIKRGDKIICKEKRTKSTNLTVGKVYTILNIFYYKKYKKTQFFVIKNDKGKKVKVNSRRFKKWDRKEKIEKILKEI